MREERSSTVTQYSTEQLESDIGGCYQVSTSLYRPVVGPTKPGNRVIRVL